MFAIFGYPVVEAGGEHDLSVCPPCVCLVSPSYCVHLAGSWMNINLKIMETPLRVPEGFISFVR